MLEKIFRCALTTKLQAILFMEANFNATYKTVYGTRMLANVRKYKLMPEEVYSERNCLANNGALSKVLFYGELPWPAGLMFVDADNCSNRIAHPMALIIFQAFGVPTKAIASMLSMIQRMQLFLHTGYGDSKDHAGGDQEGLDDPIRTQGMCQGNGSLLLPGWSQVFLWFQPTNERVTVLTLLHLFQGSRATLLGVYLSMIPA